MHAKLLALILTIGTASYAQKQQTPQLPSTTASVPATSVLLDGTEVKLRFTENLTSANAHVGQQVSLEVAEDIKVDNYTVIAKGASATALVTAVDHKKTMGRAGKLDISIVNVLLVNNKKAALCGVEHKRGARRAAFLAGTSGAVAATGAATGAVLGTTGTVVMGTVGAGGVAAAGGVVVLPVASLLLIVPGKEGVINKGSEVSAYVDGDVPLDLIQFGAPLSPEQLKQMRSRRIAVNSFDYSTVRGSIEQIFGQDEDVSRGIQALVINRITNGKKAIVVERNKLDSIEVEQSLKQKAPLQETKDGKAPVQHGAALRFANAILYGDIVVFGRDDHKNSDSSFGTFIGGFTAWHTAKYKSEKAIVAINYRLVDARTSEILATGEARGESQRQSESAHGFVSGLIEAARGKVDMTSSNFAQTIIGEATIDCVDKIAANLDAQMEKIHFRNERMEGRVAFVNGAEITVNIGADAGVNEGDKLSVNRILNEIHDPVTHEIIDVATRKVGELTIISVRGRTATGHYTGAERSQIGDQVLGE